MNQIVKIGRWLKSIIAPSNQDLKIIALSVLGASIIWLLSALNESYTTFIRCPIELTFHEENAIVVKKPPQHIEANVTGIGWDLLKQTISLNKKPLEISINNPYETRQISRINIEPLLSQHIDPLNLNFVATDSITFNIQPVDNKKLIPVLNMNSLDLADNYEVVGSVSLSPDTILLMGPESILDTLSDTLHFHIPLENIDENIDRYFPITYLNREMFSFIPSEVRVRMNVSNFISRHDEINVELVNFPLDSTVFVRPGQINVGFEIEAGSTDTYDPTDFMIIADYNNMNPNDSTINLEVIQIPPYVKSASLDTTKVKVIHAPE